MQSGSKRTAHYLFARGLVIFLIIGFEFGLHQKAAIAKAAMQECPESFAGLIEKASPSVVNIIAVKFI